MVTSVGGNQYVEVNEGKMSTQIWTKVLAESCFSNSVRVSFSTPGNARAAATTGKWTGRCSEMCYYNVVREPPGGRAVVPAVMGKSKLPGDCLVMVQTTEKSVLPDGVEVTPTSPRVTKDTRVINVAVNNLRSAPLLIQPSVVIGELQAVTAASEDGPLGECKLSRTEQEFRDSF